MTYIAETSKTSNNIKGSQDVHNFPSIYERIVFNDDTEDLRYHMTIIIILFESEYGVGVQTFKQLTL